MTRDQRHQLRGLLERSLAPLPWTPNDLPVLVHERRHAELVCAAVNALETLLDDADSLEGELEVVRAELEEAQLELATPPSGLGRPT